ncbi:hypothetical protein P3T36_002992 [Kitasatospora sp. MAP12-15]|uniref:hypothetical protein n=1 Tax=unclassified Kitasatospora TaxID=2633591 RepID=UPI002474CF68|nr:hypothetical protein [Kitasatospora sp. MAP12-44]MDH6108861.1 hypothetical protein [Kitasatospora sp. MAP12-44]
MTQHVTLPSGATADIRDVADVTERQRRPIKRTQAELAARPAFVGAVKTAELAGDSLTPEQEADIAAGMGDSFELVESLNDFLVAAMVRGWSYGFPVSADAVQDLPGRDLDALRAVCSPYLKDLLPSFEPTPDADSPIVPSGV